MDVETGDLSFVDEELSQWCLAQSIVFNLNKLLFDAIGSF